MIVGRLTKVKPGERTVHPEEFRSISTRLDVTYYRILDKWHIPGFTDDDLISFMLMKTHQILRRDQYDWERPPHSLFYASFNNLFIDIVQALERAGNNGMYQDPLDQYCYHYDDSQGVPSSEEEPVENKERYRDRLVEWDV